VKGAWGLVGVTLSGTGGGGGTSTCTGYDASYSGSLASGGSVYLPSSSGYTTSSSGTHAGCLEGPSGTNFDLYLYRLDKRRWALVAQSKSSGSSEKITYSGSSGSYRWRALSKSGSGAYSAGISHP
jgi:streptogrisin C